MHVVNFVVGAFMVTRHRRCGALPDIACIPHVPSALLLEVFFCGRFVALASYCADLSCLPCLPTSAVECVFGLRRCQIGAVAFRVVGQSPQPWALSRATSAFMRSLAFVCARVLARGWLNSLLFHCDVPCKLGLADVRPESKA